MTAPADHQTHGATAAGSAHPEDTGPGETRSHSDPYGSTTDEDYGEGRVYHVTGQDWDEVAAAADDLHSDEKLVVNMGP